MKTAPLSPSARRKRKDSTVDTAQLGLFDFVVAARETAPQTPQTSVPSSASPVSQALAPQAEASTETARPQRRSASRSPSPAAAATIPKAPHRVGARTDQEPRLLTVAEMPDYPADAYETVDRLLATLGSDHTLMTYGAIKRCFGISRATVARRLKDGLVPGVRFLNGRVVQDAPVRRFDRTQVRWLLLSVRSARLTPR